MKGPVKFKPECRNCYKWFVNSEGRREKKDCSLRYENPKLPQENPLAVEYMRGRLFIKKSRADKTSPSNLIEKMCRFHRPRATFETIVVYTNNPDEAMQDYKERHPDYAPGEDIKELVRVGIKAVTEEPQETGKGIIKEKAIDKK